MDTLHQKNVIIKYDLKCINYELRKFKQKPDDKKVEIPDNLLDRFNAVENKGSELSKIKNDILCLKY